MTPRLKKYFEKWCKVVDQSLGRFLPLEASHKKMTEAMRYSLFAGGKRLRPVLVIAGAEICGLAGRKVLPSACAMEMIHTYSLVHDDLPAMDDDDLRRGRPTNHKVFGEDIAILAGDALLTEAFELVSKNAKIVSLDVRSFAEAVHVVAEGAGYRGMVGGQAMDLEMDGGKWTAKKRSEQARILKRIHEKKTSALIQSSLMLGAILAGAKGAVVKRLSDYGMKIGLAFQIADDVLDRIGDKKLLGKKGSDAENNKLTYPAIFGIEKSKKQAQDLVREAKLCLKPFGKKSEILEHLADYIVQRTY